jgi:hypothetical protein
MMTMLRLFTRQERKREQRDELLSTYLDDQLSSRERERLEARLATDPTLQAELEALRRTVSLVRDLPPVPIPRNFILPQTAAERPQPAPLSRPRRAWAAPLLTAATVVVSLLFVVILAGDLLLVSRMSNLATAPEPSALMEAPQMAMEPSPIIEKVELEVEAERVVETPTPAPLPAEAPPLAPLAATAEEESYVAETPGDAEATVAAAVGGGGPVDEAMDLTPTPVSTTVVEEAPVALTSPGEATSVSKAPRGAEPTPSEVARVAPPVTGEVEADTSEGEWGAREDQIVAPSPILPWRVLEIALGLIALGLAFFTIRAWRARRR